MRVLVDSTNEYLKTREQFGRPIGRFQVLQHRMVDMSIASEIRSMAFKNIYLCGQAKRNAYTNKYADKYLARSL